MKFDYDNSGSLRHIHLLFYDTTKFDKVHTFRTQFPGSIISVKDDKKIQNIQENEINKIYKGNVGKISETNKSRDEMNKTKQHGSHGKIKGQPKVKNA